MSYKKPNKQRNDSTHSLGVTVIPVTYSTGITHNMTTLNLNTKAQTIEKTHHKERNDSTSHSEHNTLTHIRFV